jgi:hypothetical protein
MCGIIYFTISGSTVPLDEARHQREEFHQVRDSEQRTTLADGDLWIRRCDVGPLPWHRANVIRVDLQQKPGPVSVVPFANADHLPSTQRVERVGHAHKARAYVRRACSSC